MTGPLIIAAGMACLCIAYGVISMAYRENYWSALFSLASGLLSLVIIFARMPAG